MSVDTLLNKNYYTQYYQERRFLRNEDEVIGEKGKTKVSSGNKKE